MAYENGTEMKLSFEYQPFDGLSFPFWKRKKALDTKTPGWWRAHGLNGTKAKRFPSLSGWCRFFAPEANLRFAAGYRDEIRPSTPPAILPDGGRLFGGVIKRFLPSVLAARKSALTFCGRSDE